MAARLSALRADRPLPSRNIPGTHVCHRQSRLQGHSVAERIRSTEKINLYYRQLNCLLLEVHLFPLCPLWLYVPLLLYLFLLTLCRFCHFLFNRLLIYILNLCL
jgi:hypothetical protein